MNDCKTNYEDQKQYVWSRDELTDIKIAYKIIKRIMQIEGKTQDTGFKSVKYYLATLIADWS